MTPEPDRIPVDITVHIARPIRDDSWLQDPEFAAFRDGYRYATTQTYAIPALAKLSPEEAYHLWASIQHGVERDHPDFRVRD